MAALTVYSIGFGGTAPTFGAAAASDTVSMSAAGQGSRTFVVYKNTNAASRTISVKIPTGHSPYTESTQGTVDYTLAANTGELWIPIHSDYIETDGLVTITTSAQTNVTVAAVRADWTNA